MKFVCREEPTENLYRVLDDYLAWKNNPTGEAEKNIKFVTVVGTSGKGKTTFARRFIDLQYTGDYGDIVTDCKGSNRRYRISCTDFDMTRDPETQLSLMVLFEAFKYSVTTAKWQSFTTKFWKPNSRMSLKLTDVLGLITATFCSKTSLEVPQRLVIINLDETNALLNSDEEKDFLKKLFRVLRKAAKSFTVLTILSGTHSVDLFEQVKISQCKFVDIELKLITLEGAKEIVCGMTKTNCEISSHLEYVLTLCGGVGRYLEIAIIEMSKIGAFRQDGSIIKGFQLDSYNHFLHQLQTEESQNLLDKLTTGVLEHYPKVFERYSSIIGLLSCYTLFQWPVSRENTIGTKLVGDMEKEGLVFLQPESGVGLFICVIPFITLYWATKRADIVVQIPLLQNMTSYVSSDESENNSLHIMMAKLWGLVQKNNLTPDRDGHCEVQLSEILPLRQGQTDIAIKFRPVFSIKSSEKRIEMGNYSDYKNVSGCMAFLNAKGASFADAIIFSNPMIGIQEKQSITAKKRKISGKQPDSIHGNLFKDERAKFPETGVFVLIADANQGSDINFGDRDIFIDSENFAKFAGPLIALRKLYCLNQLNPSFKRVKLSNNKFVH